MSLLLGILAGIYFFPILKVLHIVLRGLFFRGRYLFRKTSSKVSLYAKVLLFLAQIEYHLDPIRGIIITPLVVGMSLVAVADCFLGFLVLPSHQLVIVLLLGFLAIVQEILRVYSGQKFLEVVRAIPFLDPAELFRRFKLELAFGAADMMTFDQIPETKPEYADFHKGGRPLQKYVISVKAFIDTLYIARLTIQAFRQMGPKYGLEIFDLMGALWGRRILQHVEGRFTVTGLERLQGRTGRFLFVFNHKSSLDFIFSFFAFSTVRINNRHPKIRFIVAEDHFKNNFFIYRVLGIGRAIDLAGMIFISRKNRAKSFEDLKLAAQAMIQKDVDVAIYPQGTRAAPNLDRALKRRDAGYYTTITKSSIEERKPHLKKGTSHLILNTLEVMHDQEMTEDLNLVFVGIKGAATAMPKNIYKIQTETVMEFAVGDVVSLSPSIIDEIVVNDNDSETEENRKSFLTSMNDLIDVKLSEVLGLNESLKQRFLAELKGQFRFDHDKIEFIRSSLDAFEAQSSVVYEILDRIYTLPVAQWNGYLSQLSQLLLERCVLDRLYDFRNELSHELLNKKIN